MMTKSSLFIDKPTYGLYAPKLSLDLNLQYDYLQFERAGKPVDILAISYDSKNKIEDIVEQSKAVGSGSEQFIGSARAEFLPDHTFFVYTENLVENYQKQVNMNRLRKFQEELWNEKRIVVRYGK